LSSDRRITSDNPGEFVPCFQESGVRANRFHLSCANVESYEWLRATVQSLSIPVGDSQLLLTLVKPAEVPKLMRVEVPGASFGVPKFLRLLAGQNRGLWVERWAVRHQKTTANGQLLVFGIEEDLASSLLAADNQVYVGLDRVTFRVSRGTAQS